ncbi:YfhO family protein [Streptomyces collinus]|uniref:YfhO family protein n=1 Tax=Streptomyces collinus TaxID=42684 RepID=UPI0033FEFF75
MSRPGRVAALLAAAVTVTAFCAADVLARGYPFGPRTRAVNDLGNQYVPFHAHLWDLLHGRSDGGLLVNWQSGYGSSFLPDLGTYLGSPFALLVGLFPRDEIDLAVYVITGLATAAAAVAMACLLPALRPGRWWAAGLLGASYALCGWSVADAAVNPMWLDGLIALPLLCLVGEWTLAGRHRLLGVLVVALAWTANFYTAYMATLGAGLVLLLRLWLTRPARGAALAAAGRAVLTVALGTGLAAPLVTVVWFGTRHACPGQVRPFTPVPTEDLLARLLPATYGFGSPAGYVGITALLLALALPFHRAVPGRVRTGWTALVLGTALSAQWAPTHLLWHAFATPQGSPYRQTFVLCGLLVIAAWHALSYGPPDRRALTAAAGLLALITTLASRGELVRPPTWPVLLLATTGALGGLVLLARADAGGRTPPFDPGGPPPPGRAGAGRRTWSAGPGRPALRGRVGTGRRARLAGLGGLTLPGRVGAARRARSVGLGGLPRLGRAGAGRRAWSVGLGGPALLGRAGAGRRAWSSDLGGMPLPSRADARWRTRLAGLGGLTLPGRVGAARRARSAGLGGPALLGRGGAGHRARSAGLGGLPLLGRAGAGRRARPADLGGPTRAGAGRHTRLAGLAVVVLLGAQLGETVATSAVATRHRLAHLDDYAPWGQRQQRQAAVVAGADDWPRRRTDPGREQTVANDPLLVGGQGAQYYSSLTSDVLSRTLTALGGGWTSRGRSVQSLDNAVTDVLFSVGARVHSPPDPHQRQLPGDGGPVTVTRQAVPPLVTVRSAPDRTPFGPSPYRNQELLLGSRVYTLPSTAVLDDTGEPARGRRVGSGDALDRPVITARCPAGSQVHLWAPHFSGTARLAGAPATARFTFVHPRSSAAMEPLGRAPASGRLRVELTPDRPGRIPVGAVGCLDTARLRAAAARLRATGATAVTVSDGTLRAELPAGSRGVAVVAAPRIAGWRCATGDGPARPAGEYHGLIAVPLPGTPTSTSLTCTFRPPGLKLGTAVGTASLLTLALLTTITATRRRRLGRHTAPPAPATPTEPPMPSAPATPSVPTTTPSRPA